MTWVLTVASLSTSSDAISPLDIPRAISVSTSASRGLSSSSPAGGVSGGALRANCSLYALEAGTPGTLFDVVSGANGYSPKVPGLRAGPGYDQASGLGVPRFDRLAAALPPPAG